MNRLLKGIGILLFLAVLCGGAIAALYVDLENRWNEPLAVVGEQRISIQPGDTAMGVLRQFDENGWVHRKIPAIFENLMLRQNSSLTRLQVGYFDLYPGDTRQSVLSRISSGQVAQTKITVIEGLRAKEMIAQLRQTQGLRDDIHSIDDLKELLQLRGPFEFSGQPTLEAAFLPETYQFPWGSPATEVLQRMHFAMREALDEAWAIYEQNGGTTLSGPADLLILASIIEKETALESERRQISGVFHRRMQKGMRLQTDPTVIYGLGDAFDGNLTRKHLRTDTPWNTYTRHGLPKTPICLPGVNSLLAAAQPEPGDSLYFVATGQGQHVFSATLAEHQRAVRQYQLGQR